MVKKALPSVVTIELSRFILALPLAQMNLRTGLLGGVTASNVSEYGGGFCISRGLTPMGVHAASCEVRGDVPDVDDHVQTLTVGLFDGIGSAQGTRGCPKTANGRPRERRAFKGRLSGSGK